MSQNYIATQKIKGKKINFQNLQTRNDKSQIDFRRINSINNLQTNYNYIKEYLKSRQNKDTKQAKEFSLGTIKIAQNITKGAVNLKKKILTIKTNAEPIEQMKKEAIQKKIVIIDPHLHIHFLKLISHQTIDTKKILPIIISKRKITKILLI